MTKTDLELVDRHFIAAIKAIDGHKDLSKPLPDPEDFGRAFSIKEALINAANILHEPCDNGELAIIDQAFDRLRIKRNHCDKDAIAKELLKHLLRLEH
jgi:hypothetical protein